MVQNDNVDAKDYKELAKVTSRGYVRVVEVKSMTHWLLLPNEEDIRIVYNGTYNGINTSRWGPHFALPMVRSTIRAVEKGTFMADWEIGDMLFNFMLSDEVIPFCGLDLTNVPK